MAALVAPAQIAMGDIHGLDTLEHQPAKIAAMEGSWEPREGTPPTLFGLPDMREERTKWAIEIPHLSSLILTHRWNGRVPGLLEFKPEDRPNSAVVFWSFRLMVGIGFPATRCSAPPGWYGAPRAGCMMHDRARRQAFWLGWATLGMIGAVSLWTPFLRGGLAHRWFSWPGILLTSPVPLLAALLAFGFFRSLARGRELAPFLCALGWFVLSFAGLGISLYPLIVPPTVTIWDAAAPRESQMFRLAGAAVMIPVIIAYSGYAYWVFRGKVQHGAGYH